MSLWLEAVLLSNRFAFAAGPRIELMQPFEVKTAFSVGLRGSGADLECEQTPTVQARVEGQGVRFGGELVGALQTHLLGGVAGPALRVLRTPKDTCGWPAEVPAPLGRWDDDVLSVLGDSLLEKGFGVGALLHGQAASSAPWFPLASLLPARAVQLGWRRGVLDVVTVQVLEGLPQSYLTWAMGRALAMLALLKPLRTLQLTLAQDRANDVLRFISGLASSGLPCLERLELTLRDSDGRFESVQREFASLPGVKLGFPTLDQLVVRRSVKGAA